MQKNVITFIILFAVLIWSVGSVSADSVNSTNNTTVLTNHGNIYVYMANDEGLSFDTNQNGTYYIQSQDSANGGLNAVHIANSSNVHVGDNSTPFNCGQYTFTSNQSGVFYVVDTGGRGYQDNIILMLAVNGTIPDNFKVHITASGYNWTPSGVENQRPSVGNVTYQTTSLDETFDKSDFIYGPQSWKPTAGNANYPIYYGENTSDESNAFSIMFIDLHAGLLGGNYPGGNTQFINNGTVKVDYTFENLISLAAFNVYAWNWNTSQGQGMLWTNSILPGNTGGPSGYAVQGSPNALASFTASPSTGTDPLTVQFTDHSSGQGSLSYIWNFGDGTTSTDENPTHVYMNCGNYTVKLTVTNEYGSDEETCIINVHAMDVSADLPSGSYNTDKTVQLSASDSQDPTPQIYYTLDGSDPTTGSNVYNGPINLGTEGLTILKFMAVDSLGRCSDVVTMNYNIDKTAPTVTADPVNGTFKITQNVVLTTQDASSTKTYYTTDGTDPRTSSTRNVYSSPITINTSTLLEFAALDATGNWSPLYKENYTMVDVKAPLTSADLPSGSYTMDQVVRLTAADEMDPNPRIYYTLDGTDPTTNSTLYTWPISINTIGTTFLKFIAVDNSGHISNVTTEVYTLNKPSSSGTWNSTVLNTNNTMYNSIVMDSAGYPHIAYYETVKSSTEYPQLKYAYKDGSGWHVETVESTRSGSGYYLSLALDSMNNPHIVYKQEFGSDNPNMFKYAYKDATGWHIITLATSYPANVLGDDITNINLVLYNDEPRISFYNITGGKLEYMYKSGTGWFTEDVALCDGRWNSLALDALGNPCISYYSISKTSQKGSLRYAKRTASGTWQMSIVDQSADMVGEWNSLALDASGNPYISYVLDTADGGSLKYAYWNGTQWITETVDSLSSSASKLVLTKSGSPLIVYQDFMTGNLKYAYKEGSRWIRSNIDTIDGAGHWISFALTSLGIPNVSYITANSQLKYAYLVPFNASADISGGNYNGTQTVHITSTHGTTVYYTTDGSDPRTSSTKTLYLGSISLKNTTELKFAAVDSANNWGSVYTQTYIIKDVTAPNVTVNHAGGSYYSVQSVNLSSDETADIYYTLNGTDPTKNSTKYTGPLSIISSTVLKYIGVDSSGNISPVKYAAYKIYKSVAYSYTVKIPYKKLRYWGKYRAAYKFKVKHYTKDKYKYRGKWRTKYKVKYTYVTKYKWKKGWIYYWQYKNQTRWANKWVLT